MSRGAIQAAAVLSAQEPRTRSALIQPFWRTPAAVDPQILPIAHHDDIGHRRWAPQRVSEPPLSRLALQGA